MERCSVALVSDWYPPRIGGVERQLYGLARALCARGHEVHVLTPARHEVEVDGVPVTRLEVPLIAGGEVARPGPGLVGQVRRWLHHNRVDVVHAHGMFSMTARAGLMAAHGLGVPTVFTSHSLIRPAIRPVARLVCLGAARMADGVSAVSRAAAADARRALGRADVAILPNGIELGSVRTAPPAPADTADGVRIVSVMRLTPKKNPADLVAAVPRVLARVPDPSKVRFVVVGDGPERPRLERQAARLGVAGRIEFTGFCEPTNLPFVLATAQLYASPCRSESFGIAILEARAAGLPVVAMAGGGVGEIVSDRCHGFVAGTPEEFADALARLAADGELRQTMGAAATEGLEPFGWGAVVDRHVEVYERAIASRDGRRKRPWRFRSA